MHAEAYIGSDAERADIQRCTVRVGHPVAVNIDQRLDGLHKILRRDGGHAQTVGRIVEAVRIALRAEQLYLALGSAVGLHALKNFLRVVKNGGGGVHLPRAVGNDAGVMPALACGIVHQEHMVAELFAKAELGLVLRFFFRMGCFGDFDVQHDVHSPLSIQAHRRTAGAGDGYCYYSALNR